MEDIHILLVILMWVVYCSADECNNPNLWNIGNCSSQKEHVTCLFSDKQELQVEDNGRVKLKCNGEIPHPQSIACGNIKKMETFEMNNCVFLNFKMKPFLAGKTPHGIGIKGDSRHKSLYDIVFYNLVNLQTLTIEETQSGGFFNISLEALDSLVSLSISNHDFKKFSSAPFKHLKSLRFMELRNGSLTFVNKDLLHNLKQLEILDLQRNKITRIQLNAFGDLESLYKLNLSKNRLLHLNPKLFTRTSQLGFLDVSYNYLTQLPIHLFDNASNLLELNVDYNVYLSNIPREFFKGAKQLRSFTASYCALTMIPEELFQNTPTEITYDALHTKCHLEKLFLYHQRKNQNSSAKNAAESHLLPTAQEHHLWHHGFKTLKNLNLSYNSIREINHETFQPLISLEVLDLSNNEISTLPTVMPFGPSNHLAKVILHHCKLKSLPQIDFTSQNLQYLDFSYNKIVRVILPVYTKTVFTLVLSNNAIINIKLNFVKTGSSTPSYIIDNNPFHCDCGLEAFLRFLHSDIQKSEQVFKRAEALNCNSPDISKKLGEMWPGHLNCTLRNCPEDCECTKIIENRTVYIGVVVNCSSKGLIDPPRAIPEDSIILWLQNNYLSNLKGVDFATWTTLNELYLSNNSLKTLNNMTIPRFLKVLAIENNHLNDLPSLLMETISSTVGIQVHLSGNDWICDCKKALVITWIKENKQRIADFERVQCVATNENGSQILRIKDIELGCDSGLVVPPISPLFLFMTIHILVGFILFAIAYVHRRSILVYLYVYKMYKPRQFKTDALLDSFVFCHPCNFELVEEIRRALSTRYLIRIYCEDEELPISGNHQNISYGIQISRTVILLISENFVHSPLFLVHFYKAYLQLHKIYNGRIIPIFIEKVEVNFLPSGFHSLLTNQYRITWQERFFWERIKLFLGPPLQTGNKVLVEANTDKKPHVPRRRKRKQKKRKKKQKNEISNHSAK